MVPTMSDAQQSAPKLRLETLENRFSLSSGNVGQPLIPADLPRGVIVFGGDAPPLPTPPAVDPGTQLCFGGDLLQSIPGTFPGGGHDSLTGGAGNDLI